MPTFAESLKKKKKKKKAREFQKNIYFCFSNYAKAFGITPNFGKILKEMGNT